MNSISLAGCVTNGHILSRLRQYTCIISSVLWVRSLRTAQLGSPVPPGCSQGASQSLVLLWRLAYETVSFPAHVRIASLQFLAAEGSW